MRSTARRIVLVAALLLVPAAAAATEQLEYLERVTAGAGPDERLPLVVAIHGLGDRPERFVNLFDGFETPVRLVVPRAPRAWGDGYTWFPLRDPTAGEGEGVVDGLLRSASLIAQLIESVGSQRPTRGTAVVTGFSQGGALSFVLAVKHGELVRLAVPIGGWLPDGVAVAEATDTGAPAGAGNGPSGAAAEEAAGATAAASPGGADRATAKSDRATGASGAQSAASDRSTAKHGRPRIVALHGADDRRVPLSRAERSTERLRDAGYDVELRRYPGVGHSIPAPVRDELFRLLAAPR